MVTHMTRVFQRFAFCGLLTLAATPAQAATYWWNTTDGLWTNSANWSNAASGGTTGTVPANSTADVAIFNQTAVNGNEIISLATSSTVGSIQVNNTGSTAFQSDSATSRTLTLGASGLVMNAGAGPVTIGAVTNPVRLGQANSNAITNNSSSLLTIVNGANLTATRFSFGGSGNINMSQGSLTGPGVFVKAGSGTVTLSSSNSYTGITRLDAGVLHVTSIKSVGGGSSSLGSPTTAANGTITFAGSATLLYAGTGDTTDRGIASNNFAWPGSVFTIDQSGSGLLKFTGDFVSGFDGVDNGPIATLAFRGSTDGTGEFAGVVRNSATAGKFTSVTKAGTGRWTLSGANTYSGTTGISGGVLALAGSGRLGESGSSAVTLSGGALDLGSTSQTVASVTISAGAASGDTIYGGTLSGTAFTVNFASGSAAVSATLAGTGRLTKTGAAGVLTLSGSNSYSGGTVITSGSVIVSNANALGTGAVAVANSSTAAALRLSSVTATAYALTGSANGIIASAAGASVLRVDNTGTSTTFAGGIQDGSGTMGLTLVGTGQFTLSAANTYTGVTEISGGTLALGSAGTLASSGTVIVGTTGFGGSVLDLTAKTGTFAFGSGQTVKGIGSINIGSGKTVASTGIWAPGNSIGSNAVTGNLSLSGTSQFELGTPGTSVTSPGTSDFTSVSGTLTLGGNLTLVDNADAGGQGSMAAGAYRLFTYGSSVSGSFSSVTNPLSATTRTTVVTAGSGTSAGQGVFLNVYNLAQANAQTGTVNVGTVLRSTTLSGTLAIANVATPVAGYTESLNAAFGTVTGDASGIGSVSGLAAGGTNATNMVASLSTSTAGGKVGTAQLTFDSNGAGTSGLALYSLSPQTMTLTGTVLDPAVASFTTGSTTTSLVLDFGEVNQNTSISPLSFSLANLMQTSGFTAALALYEIDMSGAMNPELTTTLSTFNTLLAGNANSYTASFSTSTSGSFENVYVLKFKSSNNGVMYAGDTTQNLTLTVKGVIAVPEPTAVALAGIGVAVAGWAAARRRTHGGKSFA